MRNWRRWGRKLLWPVVVLGVGGLVFALVLALDIPYQSKPEPTTTAPPPPVTTTPLPVMYPSAEVTGLRAGPDDHTLLVAVSVPDCAQAQITNVSEDSGHVWADAVYTTKGRPCPNRVPAELKLALQAPIANRTVALGGYVREVWHRVPTGWGKCDKVFGCDPPPADHCAPAWIAQTNDGESLDYRDRACDQNWLVTDRVNSYHGSANRVLYRWDNGWHVFGSVITGGCLEIQTEEPKFPTALCEKLPPP